ncbi:MAG: DUF4174 domain-containing protein [Pseudomonadota bacterium]
MRLLTLATATLLAPMALAADTASLTADVSPVEIWEADPTTIFDAAEIDLTEFQWVARPIVVFANTPRDPSFGEQLEELEAEIDQLIDRDVVLVVDTDPDAQSDIRQRLRPRGFMMVLIGKDGEVELRRPFPWTVRELNRSIDKMPLRQREIRERG